MKPTKVLIKYLPITITTSISRMRHSMILPLGTCRLIATLKVKSKFTLFKTTVDQILKMETILTDRTMNKISEIKLNPI